jgi:hypothetical protein
VRSRSNCAACQAADSKTPARYAKVNRRAPRVETGAVKAAAAVPKNTDKVGSRHAAITNNLNNWRSYKNWADKIRGTWEEKK